MTPFLVHDATGRILRSGTCPADHVALQARDGETAIAAHGRDDTHWVDGGAVVERPATGLPEAHTLAADADWTVPDVPEGTAVRIDGAAMGATDAEGLTLSFGPPGRGVVELAPPFPWRPARCVVIVE